MQVRARQQSQRQRKRRADFSRRDVGSVRLERVRGLGDLCHNISRRRRQMAGIPRRRDRADTAARCDTGRSARARAGGVLSGIRSGRRHPAAPQPTRRAQVLRRNREPSRKAPPEVSPIPLIGCIISQNRSGKSPTQRNAPYQTYPERSTNITENP